MTMTAGITQAGTGYDGTVWNILGQTYMPKSETESSFSFETLFPAGTFVPPHIHPTQDEFIYVLDGTFDLVLNGEEMQASTADLIRMPMGLPHGIFNKTDTVVKALFWVSPAGDLRALFDKIHDLSDPEEVVRISAEHGVDFLPPPAEGT